jgi:hypothetical protein
MQFVGRSRKVAYVFRRTRYIELARTQRVESANALKPV